MPHDLSHQPLDASCYRVEPAGATTTHLRMARQDYQDQLLGSCTCRYTFTYTNTATLQHLLASGLSSASHKHMLIFRCSLK